MCTAVKTPFVCWPVVYEFMLKEITTVLIFPAFCCFGQSYEEMKISFHKFHLQFAYSHLLLVLSFLLWWHKKILNCFSYLVEFSCNRFLFICIHCISFPCWLKHPLCTYSRCKLRSSCYWKIAQVLHNCWYVVRLKLERWRRRNELTPCIN